MVAGLLGWIVRAKANMERGSTALNSAPQELRQISEGKAISSLPSMSEEIEQLYDGLKLVQKRKPGWKNVKNHRRQSQKL